MLIRLKPIKTYGLRGAGLGGRNSSLLKLGFRKGSGLRGFSVSEPLPTSQPTSRRTLARNVKPLIPGPGISTRGVYRL